MVNIDALLNEWAYRCEKGYPDMDSPSDLRVLNTILQEQGTTFPEFQNQIIIEQEEEKEKPEKKTSSSSVIDLIQKMENDGVLKDKHITFLLRYLNGRPFQEKIDDYLNTKNINSTTFGPEEVAANERIFQILDTEDQRKFIKYMGNPLKLSDVGGKGNLFDEVKSKSGFSDDTLKKILHIKGQEEGRGVGKAELFLAMFYGDVKMRIVGSGDLTWNNKYLEVKGSGARLGGRSGEWNGYSSSKLGQIAKQYDKSDKRLSSLIANLADEIEPPTNLEELKEAIIDMAKSVYGSSDIIDKLINGLSDEDLKSEDKVRKTIIKIYYNHYAKKNKVDDFIFVNTALVRKKDNPEMKVFSKDNFKYRLFAASEIEDLIDRNEITFTAPPATDNLYPGLNKISA